MSELIFLTNITKDKYLTLPKNIGIYATELQGGIVSIYYSDTRKEKGGGDDVTLKGINAPMQNDQAKIIGNAIRENYTL
jgi:hypothetical protein